MNSADIKVAAKAVKAFRKDLTKHGFKVVNAAGELYAESMWVSTSYAGGEFEIAYWHRHGTRPSGPRTVVRVTAQLLKDHPNYLAHVSKAIRAGEPYMGIGLRA